MVKNYIQILTKSLVVITLLLLNFYAFAQIPDNAINADPSATSVTLVSLETTIIGSALMKFKFTNEALLINATGQIPAYSVRLTIKFPANSAFTSVKSIPKFDVEDFDDQPNGFVHLINNSLINEKEVIDLLLNVRGTIRGAGTITFNVRRLVPFTTANTIRANNNASGTFYTRAVLHANLIWFKASIHNCVSNITWKSNSIDNFTKYLLEYSYDGTDYIPFYEVNNQGNNYTYSTTHKSAKGKVFYRLKMVDIDNYYEYSNIIPVNANCNKNWALVYPNPTTQIINVNISTLNNLATTVVLYNAVGKRVLSQLLQNGSNEIDVNKIGAGIYTLTFSENAGINSSSIIIK